MESTPTAGLDHEALIELMIGHKLERSAMSSRARATGAAGLEVHGLTGGTVHGIDGASQLRGRPNVWGTLIAVCTLAFGIKGIGLRYPGEIDWMQPLFEGLVLIIAVAVASRQAIVKVDRRRTDPSPSGTDPATTKPDTEGAVP